MQHTRKLLLNDLKRHNGRISSEIQSAIHRVLERGWYVFGPELEAFEAEYAAWCGGAHCVGVGNGTDALELALRALEVGPGDQVVTVANAGMYASTAIRAIGAIPVYVDIEFLTMTLSPESLAAVLTPSVRAVIVTHLFGKLADIESILKRTNSAGIPVVEDCAQAHGASWNGKKAGTFGTLGCFSFYPTKNLGALGDGGAIITSDHQLAERLKRLRQYGWSQKYISDIAGGRNSRLDELQAAFLRAKLPFVDQWNNVRRDVVRRYNAAFSAIPLVIPSDPAEDYVAHLYVVRTEQRDELRTELNRNGISAEIHYPVLDHKQQSMQIYDCVIGDLEVTEKCCEQILTLPCFPELEDDEIEYVIATVRNYWN